MHTSLKERKGIETGREHEKKYEGHFCETA